jgi:hypothetical protein
MGGDDNSDPTGTDDDTASREAGVHPTVKESKLPPTHFGFPLMR